MVDDDCNLSAEDVSEAPEEIAELESTELRNDIRLLLQELVNKVTVEEEGDDPDEGHEDVEEAESEKEIRDFNNNIIFPVSLHEGEGELLGAHALNYYGASTELGIGDFAGADRAHSGDGSDVEKEGIKDLVEDIKHDLLLLQSELSLTESVDLEQSDTPDEFFEDVDAEEEMFHFREALAKLDAETSQSLVEVKPAIISEELELQEELTTPNQVIVNFLYHPQTQAAELQKGNSSDEEDPDAAKTAKPAEDQVRHPFTNWIRACRQNYRRSKSNSCCQEPMKIKRIRFASQAQIIPTSLKYPSDEESDASPPVDFPPTPPCSKNGLIKGEGLALRNNSSIKDEEAETEIQNEEGAEEEEIIRQASELSVKLQEILSDYFSTLGTLGNRPAEYEEHETGRSQDVDGDECLHTESIECVPGEEDPSPGIVEVEVENKESDIEDLKSPIQRLSMNSFLNLYMSESQKPCRVSAPASDANNGITAATPNSDFGDDAEENEYQLTEEKIQRIRDSNDLLIDDAGGFLDEATFILHAVGSATSIDDEFIHSEEWKELIQAEEQEVCTEEEEGVSSEVERSQTKAGTEEDKGTRRQSEYEHLYTHLTAKAKEVLKEKIEARDRFFDSCKEEQLSTKLRNSAAVEGKASHLHPFQYVDGWPQFDFRYEYGYYNNYCITRTGLESPRVSPREAAMQNSFKMHVQSILHELRREEDLVRVCSRGRGRGQQPHENIGGQTRSPWAEDSILSSYSPNVITTTESVIEQVFDIAELEQEAEARNRASSHNGYQFTAAAADGAGRRIPSLVTLPRTPPNGSLREEDLSKKQNNADISITSSIDRGAAKVEESKPFYGKEIVTDLDSIPTLHDGDNYINAASELSNDGVLELERFDDDNQRQQQLSPPTPTAARKSGFSFLRKVFGSSSSFLCRQIAVTESVSSTSAAIERQPQPQQLKKQSVTNLLSPFFNHK